MDIAAPAIQPLIPKAMSPPSGSIMYQPSIPTSIKAPAPHVATFVAISGTASIASTPAIGRAMVKVISSAQTIPAHIPIVPIIPPVAMSHDSSSPSSHPSLNDIVIVITVPSHSASPPSSVISSANSSHSDCEVAPISAKSISTQEDVKPAPTSIPSMSSSESGTNQVLPIAPMIPSIRQSAVIPVMTIPFIFASIIVFTFPRP